MNKQVEEGRTTKRRNKLMKYRPEKKRESRNVGILVRSFFTLIISKSALITEEIRVALNFTPASFYNIYFKHFSLR
jgi:hypothetical protein